MRIKSPKFAPGGEIPSLYTCEGYDWNPPVEFHDVPKEAKSLVLIMEDPDVPTSIRPDGLWVHWIVYEMSPSTTGIPEHSAPPGVHGRGTNGRTAYMGPCPPDREHRYFFRLYALDFMPDWKKGMTKDEVMQEIEGHVLAEAELMGTYKLKKPPK
jgi:Raf kinase inhibitor-like YbhB/YbcL family protein